MANTSDDIVRFFSNTAHCKPDVLKRIVSDVCTLCASLNLSRRSTTWGTTQQPKLCIYGGVPIRLKANKSSSSPVNNSKRGGDTDHYVLPLQIWLAHQYPIEPPTIFLFSNEASCKIANNHKYVDVTGRCYTPELAAWNPVSSSLSVVVEKLGRVIEEDGMCPLYVDSDAPLSPFKEKCRRSRSTSLAVSKADVQEESTEIAEDDNGEEEEEDVGEQCVVCIGAKDTVLVPCGHYCLCGACATNLSHCPICREPVKFRQRVFA